jgi:hypothetical protein
VIFIVVDRTRGVPIGAYKNYSDAANKIYYLVHNYSYHERDLYIHEEELQ